MLFKNEKEHRKAAQIYKIARFPVAENEIVPVFNPSPLFLKLLLHNKRLPRTTWKVYKYEPVCKNGEEYCGQPGHCICGYR